jgi:hypothetical protein
MSNNGKATDATCHQCGHEAPRPFRVAYPNGARHVFCDSDCLRRWLADQQTLFEVVLKSETAELAASVNGDARLTSEELATGFKPGVPRAVGVLESAFYMDGLTYRELKQYILEARNALVDRPIVWDEEKYRAGRRRCPNVRRVYSG